jgi:hypothetical protein
MPKSNATAKMEGTRKGGRPCERWWEELEEDLTTKGIKKNGQAMVRDRQERRKIVLEAEVHNGLEHLCRR